MTTKTVKLIVFITLLVHGIGHLQGVVSSSGVKFTSSTTCVSWLLKGLGKKTNQIICFILYLAAAVVGIITALCFQHIITGLCTWQTLALITAIVSSLCLIFFPRALAMFFNKARAIAVNLIIYYSILLQGNWPAAIFED